MRLSPEAFVQARSLIAARLGLDFPERRRNDLEQRLIQALPLGADAGPEAWLLRLAALPAESPELLRLAGYLTVGETYFFRDHSCFRALAEDILPTLIAARRSSGVLRLRVWSAGCSTGEEPYSLAMLLDRLLPDRSAWKLTILATDINPNSLERARQASYGHWSFRNTPASIRDRYFRRADARTFELNPDIRRMVTFAPLNLAEDRYPSMATSTTGMDLILCRNVLMYLTRDVQRAVVRRLQQALLPAGWLAVSAPEVSASLLHPLRPINFPGAVLFRNDPDSPDAGPVSMLDAMSPLSGTPSAARLCFPPSLPAGMGVSSPVTSSPGCSTRTDDAPVPGAPGTLVERARFLADQGDLDGAWRLCEGALERDRLDPDVHFLQGVVCQQRGELPAAVDALRRAIYLAPDYAPAHFLLGRLLLGLGDQPRGRRSMETVVRLLQLVPAEEPLTSADGLTAGRLLETARAWLARPVHCETRTRSDLNGR